MSKPTTQPTNTPDQALRTKRFFFTVGGKGGVGKTHWMKAFLDYLNDSTIPSLVFDADDTTRSLNRIYPAAKVVPLTDRQNQEVHREMEQMFDAIVGAQEPVALTDFRAGCADQVLPTLSLILEHAKPVLEANDIGITAVAVITNEADSLFSIAQWATELGNGVDWVFVRNEMRGKVELLDGTDFGQDIKKQCKPTEIVLPALDRKDAAALRNYGMTVADALKAKEEGKKIPGVTDLVPNLRFKSYQTTLFTTFADLLKKLIRLN